MDTERDRDRDKDMDTDTDMNTYMESLRLNGLYSAILITCDMSWRMINNGAHPDENDDMQILISSYHGSGSAKARALDLPFKGTAAHLLNLPNSLYSPAVTAWYSIVGLLLVELFNIRMRCSQVIDILMYHTTQMYW
jgi:hypothetical protein